jgi:hypothetical protein
MGIIKLETIQQTLMEKYVYMRKGWNKETNKKGKKLRKRKEEQRRRKISGRNDHKEDNFIDSTTVLYTASRMGI